MVKEDTAIAKSSHKRLYDTIIAYGIDKFDESDNRYSRFKNASNIKKYTYFYDEFFGMERVISKIMNFLKSASARGEESRQVLLLMGPVGAGKSALIEHIKQSLESETYYHLEK